MTPLFRRAALALAIAGALLAPLSGTALADSSSHGKSSGQTASADWVEYGTLPGGVPGNVHVGFLFVDAYSRSAPDVFGAVSDWSCDPGEVPGGGGHEEGAIVDEEPVENLCDFEGKRFISNFDAVFTMSSKGSQATLKGALRVEGHDAGGATAFPLADMTWTAIGETYSYRVTETYSDGTSTYSYRYSFTGADAAMSGAIGAMGFIDDADDESFGSFGSYRNMYRERTR